MPSKFAFTYIATPSARETSPTSVTEFLAKLPAEVKVVLSGPVDHKAIAALSTENLVLAMRGMDRLPQRRIAVYNALGKALATRQHDQAQRLAAAALSTPSIPI
jgi:hypothetical protein